jgi:prepilin-type N-terminal cleavage/methylation domain-containing protein
MRQKQRGFSLVELMVAITILLVAILAILGVMTSLSFKHMEVKEKIVAVNLAQSIDALIESMDDLIVVNTTTGSVVPFHDLDITDLKNWKPVVLWMDGATYRTDLPIKINNVNYIVRVYAEVNPINSISPGNPPSIGETNITSKNLITVAYIISWKTYGGKIDSVAFMRRYFKKGAR